MNRRDIEALLKKINTSTDEENKKKHEEKMRRLLLDTMPAGPSDPEVKKLLAKPIKITHMITMGDSLTERGTMNARMLGPIPMSKLSGLEGVSPRGRFDNGWTWPDFLGSRLVSQYIIQRFKRKYELTDMDIADAVITGKTNNSGKANVDKQIHEYTMMNNALMDYRGRKVIRSYDEGGATSYNYKWSFTASVSRFFTRMIVSSLDEKRAKLLADDKRMCLEKHRKESLVIEWSGANDLITVNKEPTIEEADRAVAARFKNIKELIDNGYQYFVLVNIPDLSLTPRYQNQRNESERANARYVCNYFNQHLEKARIELMNYARIKRIECSVTTFDAHNQFNKLYSNPENYGFDRSTIKEPMINSPDYKINPNGAAPGNRHLFYDDLHVSSQAQFYLSQEIQASISKQYEISEPEPEKANVLCADFQTKYAELYSKHKHGLFRALYQSNLKIDYKNAQSALKNILKHALYEDGHRTLKVITDLGWIDENGNVNTKKPALKKAMHALDMEMSHQLNAKVKM